VILQHTDSASPETTPLLNHNASKLVTATHDCIWDVCISRSSVGGGWHC
jgi:hypothetical protein